MMKTEKTLFTKLMENHSLTRDALTDLKIRLYGIAGELQRRSQRAVEAGDPDVFAEFETWLREVLDQHNDTEASITAWI